MQHRVYIIGKFCCYMDKYRVKTFNMRVGAPKIFLRLIEGNIRGSNSFLTSMAEGAGEESAFVFI